MEADVSGEKEHVAFQFNVTGEGEGAFSRSKRGSLGMEKMKIMLAMFTCMQIAF